MFAQYGHNQHRQVRKIDYDNGNYNYTIIYYLQNNYHNDYIINRTGTNDFGNYNMEKNTSAKIHKLKTRITIILLQECTVFEWTP